MSYLYDFYKKNIIPSLIKKYNYKNLMQCPKLQKIVLNIGLKDEKDNAKVLENIVNDLTLITGQKAVLTRAKKSISNFKLRQGMVIGCKVTLRRKKMYEFFYKFINIAIPRIRDFQGFNLNSFDKYGNYNIGLKEQYIFPEIDLDKSDKVRGLNVTFVISTNNIKANTDMLFQMGMPFKKKKYIEE